MSGETAEGTGDSYKSSMTKIKYNGRDTKGRFSRKGSVIGIVLTLFAMAVLTAHPWVSAALGREIKADNPPLLLPVFPVAHADVTMEAKIEALKDELVDDLARKCETKDAKEPDSVIIFDSNNQASIGAWQFQIKTVQHYVKLFEGRDISRADAIRIAIDHEQARSLAKRIIFEEQGGVFNWANCEAKLDLAPEIEVIKKLTQ